MESDSMTKDIFPPTGHSVLVGYIFWIFGFTGAHRFYYGKKWTGLLWMATFGLMGVGWLIDAFLIPSMDEDADIKYISGPYNYNIAWALLTFGGILGLHRFYIGKIGTGLLYLCTFGLFTLGWTYDFWKMNELVSEANREAPMVY